LGFASLILLAILMSSLQPILAADAQPAEIGKKPIDMILGATWTKRGICVQIGCGDGTLTSEIASVSQWVVQALDKEPARVDKARAALQTKGLYGQASVEVGGFERLPYEDNLIDLVVVGDLHPSQKNRERFENGVCMGRTAVIKKAFSLSRYSKCARRPRASRSLK